LKNMTQRRASSLAVVFFVSLVPALFGQPAQKPQPKAPPTHTVAPGAAEHGAYPGVQGGHLADTPVAKPADVATPEAVVAAYYESLSGPAGKKRDWNRFLSLFFHSGRLLPAEGKGHGGQMARSFTPHTYLYNAEIEMYGSGYFVREVGRRSVTFGKMAEVLSTYEARHAEADSQPYVRGLTSFQLVYDHHRWSIFSVLWQPETAAAKLSPELLKAP
jgi:hypothetical protein